MTNRKRFTTVVLRRQTGREGPHCNPSDYEEKIVLKDNDVITLHRGAVHFLQANDELWARYPGVSGEAIDSLFEWLTGMSPNQFDRYYRKIHRHSATTSPMYRRPLSDQLRRVLANAIPSCNIPCFTFDFVNNVAVPHESIREVERSIRDDLQSEQIEAVRDGLSNVLCWSHLRNGNKGMRINRFRHNVTPRQLAVASKLFRHLQGPGIVEIKGLKLPEFSGLSSISKLRMFLDPSAYVALDRKLLKVRGCSSWTLFHNLKLWGGSEHIPVTTDNQRVYQSWCETCRRIGGQYFGEAMRAVDIERGILHLVNNKRGKDAAQILETA